MLPREFLARCMWRGIARGLRNLGEDIDKIEHGRRMKHTVAFRLFFRGIESPLIDHRDMLFSVIKKTHEDQDH